MPTQNTPAPAPAYPATNGGLILIGDIVGFSLHNANEQKVMVDHMWSFLQRTPLLDVAPKPALNGTGDGALIAFIDASQTHDNVIQLAVNWIEDMKKCQPSAHLRIGVHQGPFQQIAIEALGCKIEPIGTGPNDCARIVSFGDGGSIIVSEKFVEGWKSMSGPEVLQHFHPSDADFPIHVHVKHDVPQALRIYKYLPNQKAPRRLAEYQAAERRLMDILEAIEEQFTRSVDAGKPNMPDISARVSILAPFGDELRSTKYRFQRGTTALVGKTRYSIRGSGTGPAGRAYCKREIQIAADLPDFHTEPDKYIAALRTWRLSAKTVKGFGRHSRTFIDLPMGFPDHKVDLVVCIDALPPLSNDLPVRYLREIADHLMCDYGELLPLIWQRRLQ